MPLLHAEFRRYAHLLNRPLFHDTSQVLCLPFDKDDGSYARDHSGYNNHGTIYGASRVAGKVAGALSFDGIDDYVEVPDNASLKPSTISLMCWYYRLGAGQGTYDLGIINKYNSVTSTGYLLAEDKGTDRLWVHFGLGSYWGHDSLTWFNNKWTHIAVVSGGSGAGLYINGIWQTGSALAMSNCDLPLHTGKFYPPAYGGFVNAIIDEIRVYNRAFSPAEILRVMNLRGI